MSLALAASAAAYGAAPDGSGSEPSAQAQPGAPTAKTVQFAKGRLLVRARAGLKDKDLDQILRGHAAKRVDRIEQIDVHIVELPAQASEVAMAQVLRRHRHLKFAELDVAVPPSMLPNDPYYGNAWHLPKIGAPAAWDVSSGAGVTVAILDSGIDGSHPDLVAQMVPGWNVYDNNSDTRDVYGHGTVVAGAAAATGANGAGVIGVGYKTKLMPVRISDAAGYAYFSTMAKGITWAADNGARVANLSFENAAGSSTVMSAADYMRSKGGVVVIAAGNSGLKEAYAASNSATVVSATDSNDAVTSWSSYGSFLDLAAPGSGIWTTAQGGGYKAASGTSLATPIVAGTYALMMAANPSLSPPALDSALYATALDLGTAGFDERYGNGRVNTNGAVVRAQQTVFADTSSPSVSISAPTGGQVRGLTPVDVSASDNVGVARAELYAAGTLIAADTSAPFAFSLDTSVFVDGSLQLVARAYDAVGNVGTSAPVTVTVANDTSPPTVQVLSPANGSVVTGTVQVSAAAQDNKKVAKLSLFIDGREVAVAYGDTLSYRWKTGTSTRVGGSSRRRPGGSSTTSTLTARAVDPAGNQSQASITVTRQ
jgi:subtilisin family serine protease